MAQTKDLEDILNKPKKLIFFDIKAKRDNVVDITKSNKAKLVSGIIF